VALNATQMRSLSHMLCLKYSILQMTTSALFVMRLKLCPSANSWYTEMLLSWRTYRNFTVSTWLLATWLGTVAKWTAWIIWHFVTLGFSFVWVVFVSCILSVCLSVCVCLLCGGRIKIVNVFLGWLGLLSVMYICCVWLFMHALFLWINQKWCWWQWRR